jgi:hypothetical protein
MKKEQTSKRAKSQRSVQREMKEVLAELVEKLRGKLEPKTTPASRGDAGQRTELSPNLDRRRWEWIWATNGATTAYWVWRERR